MKNIIYDNNAVKRRNITVFIATIVFLAVLACYIGSAFLIEIVQRDFRADVSFEGKYKNIILMIGDGMGFIISTAPKIIITNRLLCAPPRLVAARL